MPDTCEPSDEPSELPYDNGGRLPLGVTLIHNDTGRPQRVLTAQQWAKIIEALR